MKPVEKWKSRTFVASLIVIAAIVDSIKQPRLQERTVPSQGVEQRPAPTPIEPQQQQISQQPPPPREKTPEELAAERQRYIARLMNERPSPTPGTKSVAVVVVDEKNRLNASLASILAKRIKANGIKPLTSLFTPEFVSDGAFKAAFGDSAKPIDDLELRGVLDSLLLAQATVEYEANPSLENVISATMELEIRFISIARRGESQSWTFRATGPGFKESDARKAAEERIIKQLSNDTNIVISASR